jgi:hypothetical protein
MDCWLYILLLEYQKKIYSTQFFLTFLQIKKGIRTQVITT